ncbi:hypothetical protein Pyn_27580 [Prunus yedoensis var. nudiflora]|uniref:Uncharacterized protein n=1 Tax=Prunus yedoensis var. nudiflora TaxID=2094558 RepID=A0A314YAB5_PRUYE|nr:hypothetical protein Pyn_27580 [Prunus yedoensis var. nudiflora]
MRWKNAYGFLIKDLGNKARIFKTRRGETNALRFWVVVSTANQGVNPNIKVAMGLVIALLILHNADAITIALNDSQMALNDRRQTARNATRV